MKYAQFKVQGAISLGVELQKVRLKMRGTINPLISCCLPDELGQWKNLYEIHQTPTEIKSSQTVVLELETVQLQNPVVGLRSCPLEYIDSLTPVYRARSSGNDDGGDAYFIFVRSTKQA